MICCANQRWIFKKDAPFVNRRGKTIKRGKTVCIKRGKTDVFGLRSTTHNGNLSREEKLTQKSLKNGKGSLGGALFRYQLPSEKKENGLVAPFGNRGVQ